MMCQVDWLTYEYSVHRKKLDEPCVETSEVARKKFPHKVMSLSGLTKHIARANLPGVRLQLIEFYEKNLRWRTAETSLLELN